MGTSQSEQRLEDAFSDEETSGYGGGSPTQQSYRPQSFSAHGSPGGDLSDEELYPANGNGGLGPHAAAGLESICVPGGHMEFAVSQQQQQQPCARSRSGSCTSRRSQFRFTTQPQQLLQQQQRRASAGPLGQPGDRSSSMGETTVSSTSRESVLLPLDTRTRRSSALLPGSAASGSGMGALTGGASSSQYPSATLARYSNTSTYSMSKSVSTGTDLSDEAPDNVIYSDINDLYRHRKSTTSGGSGGGGGMLGESRKNVDEEGEEIEEDDEIMDEVEDENAIRRPYLEDDEDDDEIDIRYATATQIKAMASGSSAHFDEYCGNNRYSDTSDYFSHSQQHYSQSPNSHSLATTITHKNGLTDDDDRYSCSNPPPIHPRTSHSLPRNSQLAKIESIDSNYSGGEGRSTSGGRAGSSGEHNFIGHHSLNNLPSSSKVTNDYLHYSSLLKGGGTGGDSDDPMNSKKTSSERLEYELSNANIYSTVQYKNYEDDFEDEDYMNYQRQRDENRDVSKEAWLRSSSCKELCDYGYDSTGRADFSLMEREFLTSDRIDSPVTRYDDSRHSMYVQKSNYSVEVSQDYLGNEG
uniref:Uncharacterized protein n=1 Tax=Anopheles maculatus TaxID=74869 RepID=A0A182TCH6_9DIPT